jgi:hypothetical protein
LESRNSFLRKRKARFVYFFFLHLGLLFQKKEREPEAPYNEEEKRESCSWLLKRKKNKTKLP